MTALWLASGSPRRRQLLAWAGFTFEVHPPDVDERWDGEDPVEHASVLAVRKAATGPRGRVVLAADTVVHRGDRVFGKPTSREHAFRILSSLQGGWHDVTTGVCARGGGQERAFTVTTAVRFRTLSERDLTAYIDTGAADDKAGAYGIQGQAGVFVAEVRGSWTNVMGLPIERTVEALTQCGAGPWT